MLFRNKYHENCINSPIIGKTIPLEEVKDVVFSKRLLGDGIAFVLEGDTIYAPCNGKIKMIAKTKHAFGIQSENGTEILLHIGLDTVNLHGKGMELLVKNNKRVKQKTPLLRIDREYMKKNDIDLTIILIITNNSDYEMIMEKKERVDLDSIIIRTKKLINKM